MATLDFETLKTKYGDFEVPTAVVKVNDKPLPSDKLPFHISDIDVDLTCGFEASIASFSIYNVYSTERAMFRTEEVKKYIYLGSKLEVFVGYGQTAKSVFVGVIVKVSYQFEETGVPCIRVTAMDAKGIMMSGNYSRQLKATKFTDAVKEIFSQPVYSKLQSKGIIKQVDVSLGNVTAAAADTANASAETIEMVAESDYEFLVKLAKKNNYEFFCDCGIVYFRKAKEVRMPLFTLTPSMGILNFDIEYDITGLSETIYARSTDVDKGKLIEAKSKYTNTISLGNKASPIIKGTERVYIDPTISSKEDAEARVDSLMEDMAFRYGSLTCEMVGLPEMKPGYFLDLQCLGPGASNVFYIMNVRHRLTEGGIFTTEILGKTNSIML